MKMEIFFSESEMKVDDFEFYLDLLHDFISSYFHRTTFDNLKVQIYKGVPDETQEEEACNKGVCKQRRNKTVNARKSS